nr:class A beta-lactamase [Pigmentiphaga aceris]
MLGRAAKASPVQAERFRTEIARIEAASGGRLGVAILDTHDGVFYGHREDERFPMCSTFKFLLAAHVLARVDRKEERLDRRVAVRTVDLVAYSPATQPHADGEPMSIAALCDASVTLSDNTAANLLLASAGGPAGLTAYLRQLGDAHTRLDRNEPSLNTARPGDPRDTTTPAAMLGSMRKLVLGDALSPASRTQLTRWLVDNKTGDARLRAGIPKGWKVGDKTGSGAYGTNNDIGVIWPSGRDPVLVTAYLTGTVEPVATRERALAEVGKLVTSLVSAKLA